MTKTRTSIGQAADAPSRFRRILERWRGRLRTEYDLSPYIAKLEEINDRENDLRAKTDEQLKELARRLRTTARGGDPADELQAEVYALVRESARRVLGMRHFDVQIVGGLALQEGKLVEMQTGEGKTLVAVLPAVFSAFRGTKTHVLTFNDYLARRDARWMSPIYEFLGVDVKHVEGGMTLEERREAYGADVTYLTAKEAGFDYLRDGLCYDADQRVHQGFRFAIVDEADSILIDEARIPLVIAGAREPQPHNATHMAAIARGLTLDVHYETDENNRNVYLTDRGLRRVEDELDCGSLHDPENTQWLTEINVALHAKELLRRDGDYIVRRGAIELVDEFTGRVVTDRQWPDGLQVALEAKEGLRFGQEGAVLGTVTLQHFFGLYDKLAGMTATARPEDEEFTEFYDLTVVVLPPNQPCVRRDQPDHIFVDREAKNLALVEEISNVHASDRPVLVGTASVSESEELSTRLRERGMSCEVLNAKTDDLEAQIVAEAGAPGALTISTNMAGRGTDIRLGGADERDREQVVTAGGLYVIGTNRHESRRIDRQLRGRAGRQGDPGTSRFYISLEDDVMERYGVGNLLVGGRGRTDGSALDHPLAERRIDWAQRVIEGQNFEIRRTLLRYGSFLEQQRRIVRDQRDDLLFGSEPPLRWRQTRPERYGQLVDACGPVRAEFIERQISLYHMDRLWEEHLRELSDLRENIHMVRLGNKDPLPEFLREADGMFRALLSRFDENIVGAIDRLELTENGLSLERMGIRGPSSTWTYLIDDNPFRDVLGLHVAGNIGLSLGAVMLAPFYIGVALYRRYFKNRRERG